MTPLRVALVQQETAWHDPAENLRAAATWVERAAAAGARVVAFPELFSTGFTMEPEPFAESLPGPTSQAVGELAARHGVYVVASAIRRADPRPRNCAFVAGPDGGLLHVYEKIHPFSYGEESRHYSGGEACVPFEIDGIPAALQVCYDLRFPEPLRALASRGVVLAFYLANWPASRAAHWSTLLAARAIENQMIVCGVNRAGRDPKLEYPGLSVVHDARGEVIARAGSGEQLLLADLDVAAALAWRQQFPALEDRRPEVYARL